MCAIESFALNLCRNIRSQAAPPRDRTEPAKWLRVYPHTERARGLTRWNLLRAPVTRGFSHHVVERVARLSETDSQTKTANGGHSKSDEEEKLLYPHSFSFLRISTSVSALLTSEQPARARANASWTRPIRSLREKTSSPLAASWAILASLSGVYRTRSGSKLVESASDSDGFSDSVTDRHPWFRR